MNDAVPPRSGRKSLAERDVDRIGVLLDRLRRRHDVTEAFIAMMARGARELILRRELMAVTPEFQRFANYFDADPDVHRIFDRKSLEVGLLSEIGFPIASGEVRFRETYSIHGRFLEALRDVNDVEEMRERLAAGQIWLRFDVIPIDQIPLAVSWASLQRHELGLPRRRGGRPVGSRDFNVMAFEVAIDHGQASKSIWQLAVKEGLTHGPYKVPGDEDLTVANRRWVARRRRAAKKLRETAQP